MTFQFCDLSAVKKLLAASDLEQKEVLGKVTGFNALLHCMFH
jgi:hypothetical protein